MKNCSPYLATVLVVACVLIPSFASAQSARHRYGQYPTATSTVQADTPGTTPAQQQNIRGWRGSSQFQQQISALSSTPVQALPMPVLFGVEPGDLTPNFGDPRDNGTRTHEGEDIMAVSGTPIVSPTDAVVLKTETGVSEGNAVYTANPGGETLVYMHLDHFGEGVVAGEVLQPGSLIGYVGNTGDAAGGPAHLHLEVHNSSGTPTDPFPRLTAEFTVAQKISFLAKILTQTSNSTTLARFLVTNFRSTFATALAANVSLPTPIIDALVAIPASTVSANTGTALPTGDLDLGSSGAAVTTLQLYLIHAASGAAATKLAAAGATGTFGPLTQAALIEYQKSVGISPASGYYGPATRGYVLAHPLTGTAQTSTTTTSSANASLTRDLSQGMTGEDVRTLQKLLNANGFVVATTGAGSLGSESTYFGPATQAAVIRFQTSKNISPAVGYVGPLTCAALAAL